MESFKRPLTAQEELFYLQAYRDGDNYARSILIEHNLRLVAHVIKKYSTCEKEYDDLLSIGTIGLIKAIQTFDLTKNYRLATYAAKCIDNELLMMLRSEKKSNSDISIYESVGTDKEGHQINLIDVLGNTDDDTLDQMCRNESIQILRRGIRKVLTAREYDIIVRRYGLDGHKPQPQRELATQLNISRSYVSRIEKKALEKLRSLF